MENIKKERVIAYIDGYNLYFGLIDSHFERYLWLDVKALVQALLKPNQELVSVKYFTTLITTNVDKRLRQKQYIGALQSLENVTVIFGKFQHEKGNCGVCGGQYTEEKEKMTDVGIATHIMSDFYEDKFDMGMIISGDTDLIPPIKMINEGEHNKRVFVAFPPDRINDEVRKFAKGDMVIGRKKLADSQLSLSINNAMGATFNKPAEWT